MTERTKIVKIVHLLEKSYGKPRAFRKTNAVDEIIRTVLSQNTNDRNSLAAFAVLKEHFKHWEDLLAANVLTVAKLIKHAGLANIKARRIKGVLEEIKRREGTISLSVLGKLDAGPALEYLRSIKGVGAKTASCVLLFSFNKPVMPVDTHIFRVTKRLGLISDRSTIEEVHEQLTALVPKRLIYEFHLGIIEHGRRTCKAQNPRCGFCVLYHICMFRDKAFYKGVRE